MFAILGTAAAVPAIAQTNAPSQPAPVGAQKTETKVVCEKVTAEQETGSRLGAATKVCRKVEVPVKPKSDSEAQADGHSGHES